MSVLVDLFLENSSRSPAFDWRRAMPGRSKVYSDRDNDSGGIGRGAVASLAVPAGQGGVGDSALWLRLRLMTSEKML